MESARQSHKEALGAAFRARRIFGADKTEREGPSFSQASLPYLAAGHVGSTLAGENERVLHKNFYQAQDMHSDMHHHRVSLLRFCHFLCLPCLL